MTRFDRYVFSQLVMLFGFFSLVLVMIYWINRAVTLFDQLIANGQSASVFVELTVLTLPNAIRLVLPIAAFAAALYVATRLSSESELVVARTAGQSAARLMRPVVAFGIAVAAMVALLTHVLVPLSAGRLADRQVEIRENVTARLLTEGQFIHPAPGFTFYIREITPAGELRDVFLSDSRKADERTDYTARQALLIRHGTGPKLVMFDGMVQTFSGDGSRLAVTRFQDFSFDVSVFLRGRGDGARGMEELPTRDLLSATPALAAETGATPAAMAYEGHGRTSQALLAVVAAAVGFAAPLIGQFSRFGAWPQALGAVVLIIGVKLADNALADIAISSAELRWLAYGAVALGALAAAALVFLAERPRLVRWLGSAP